jgi:hypothetical protein
MVWWLGIRGIILPNRRRLQVQGADYREIPHIRLGGEPAISRRALLPDALPPVLAA